MSRDSRSHNEEYDENSDDSDILDADDGDFDQTNSKSKQKETGYSWESEYKRSWDVVAEDESGSLTTSVNAFIERNKRRRRHGGIPIQRAIIRHNLLVLDLSLAMSDRDMRPNRFLLSLEYAREYVKEYFDQNPIGQMGAIGMRSGVAEWICKMSGSQHDLVKSLQNKNKLEPNGEPSLQNALEMARASMAHLPTHASREIVVVFGSLTTCDPGNIHDTLRALIRDKIRVNIISLAAEVRILREVAEKTGGTFSVALDEGHYKDVLFETVPPPAVHTAKALNTVEQGGGSVDESDLMQMGFAVRLPYTAPLTLCACHSELRRQGYICPRCGSKLCDIPTDCAVCDLVVVSSPHLARSYHHLFPVPDWAVVNPQAITETSDTRCFGCRQVFPPVAQSMTLPTPTAATVSANISATGRYRCPKCMHDFCSECDIYCHETLHVCPGCQ
ncbi:TFIIH basal transcription factor complex, subunit SSL1 [Wallemia mellicola]|uniref:General transcription and DNA repair factor IIH n=1 Tax=Wallemia mellicola TaxID=1708541 RepID=A0A4T0M0Z9_9BASI|nr:hypothetical protein E3Q24_03474 [Wallemia mellicola]TIB72075.1 hypothetical protein E3Q23_03524 [Wallemia mellicola]TIB76168.1 TFIIH basal transcription factor complex, subunit SSL1 [Wallemia mellicola]TIB80777.1 TFIIH basal transcription factor complex, subunit SSL1 [Wallemia mellicola]TIB84831.1 TFIIH basal transcription factor complex, subunit SSL1 [Wallemia mellicola]